MNQSLGEIPILFIDQDLLVINKSAGLLSLPDGYDNSLPHVKSVLSPKYGSLWIVHRLDRFTSGVMVLARNREVHRDLNTQFQNHKVKKVYLALIVGCPAWQHETVRLPLQVNTGRKHRTVVDLEKGKPSETEFMVLERFADYCLIEARPKTGRRHQIRAHLSFEGYPIVCDSLYATQGETIRHENSAALMESEPFPNPILNRIALHASSLEIVHPGNNQRLHLHAPLPEDMQLAIEKLRS